MQKTSTGASTLNTAFAVLASLCLIGTSAFADSVETEHFSWEEGLSQTTVFSILEDGEGSIWFATEDGLNRFNGETFDVFRHDPVDPSSIPGNLVRGLDKGMDGRIWAATEGGGIGVWDPATNAFRSYRRTSLDDQDGLSSNYARAVLADSRGYVWIATRDAGLDRLDPATGEVTHFRNDKNDTSSIADNRVYALTTIDGVMYVGTNQGLDRFDHDTHTFTHIDLDNGGSSKVRKLYQDSAGILWVGTSGSGLLSYDSVSGAVEQYVHGRDEQTLGDNHILSILEDNFGQLWVGTAKGLDLLNRASGQFRRYNKVHIDKNGGSGSVTSMFVTADHSMWIGTELGGLILWENDQEGQSGRGKGKDKDKFKALTTLVAESNPLGSDDSEKPDIVTAFTDDRKGRFYIGTVGGGLVKVEKNGERTRYGVDSDNPQALSDDRVMSLYRDSRNRIWVGTMRGGVNRYFPKKDTFRTFRNDPEDPRSISADGVMSIHEDAKGSIWIGTFGGGLNRFNQGNTFTAFRHDPKNPSSLSSDRITAVLGRSDGLLWVGTDGGGLNLFNPATGEALQVRNDPEDPTSLPADTVCSLFIDNFGSLWVGTRGGGLSRMLGEPIDGLDAQFLTYTEADGLPNAVVYAIQPDTDGRMWLSTNNGLSQFDPMTSQFMNFDVNDGLQANEFNFGASFRNASGEIFFGGINGYNALAPANPINDAEVLEDDGRNGRGRNKRSRDRNRRAAAPAVLASATFAGF